MLSVESWRSAPSARSFASPGPAPFTRLGEGVQMPGWGRQRASTAWKSVKTLGESTLASARGAAGDFTGRFENAFSLIEERRLHTILSGERVAGCETGGAVTLALRRRHWLGVVGRLIGIGLGMVLVVWLPVILSALAIAVGHGVAVKALRSVDRRVGMTLGGIEIALFVGVFLLGGAALLWVTLVAFLIVMAVLVVWAWRVDMELVTTGRRLIRTRGLWMMRRQAFVPLDSIRASSVSGPYIFGIGSVTFDSASDEDRLLHSFGLMSDPDKWAAQVMSLRRIDRPSSD